MIENVNRLTDSLDKIDTLENSTVKKHSEQSIRIFRDPKTLQLSSGNAEICPEPATRISPIANNLTEGGTYSQLPKQPRFFVHMYFKLISQSNKAEGHLELPQEEKSKLEPES